MTRVPVIEVGGSHVSASWVDLAARRRVVGSAGRVTLDPHGTAAAILDQIADAARPLGDITGSPLAIAIPGPFDYDRGVGRFRNVGKFDALDGVDIGTALRPRLIGEPSRIAFLNDAAAFGLGEWFAGAARGCSRTVAITIGTGVGSAFVDNGRVVSDGPGVPPEGHLHRTTLHGRALEDVVSRRAIEAQWRKAAEAGGGGLPPANVRRITELARAGLSSAAGVVNDAFLGLGEAARPWLVSFDAQLLVVGGGLTGAWDLIEAPLRAGLGAGLAKLGIAVSRDADESAAVGAAWYAMDGVDG